MSIEQAEANYLKPDLIALPPDSEAATEAATQAESTQKQLKRKYDGLIRALRDMQEQFSDAHIIAPYGEELARALLEDIMIHHDEDMDWQPIFGELEKLKVDIGDARMADTGIRQNKNVGRSRTVKLVTHEATTAALTELRATIVEMSASPIEESQGNSQVG